jgi:O-antigen/teichoic acid export membrane protein
MSLKRHSILNLAGMTIPLGLSLITVPLYISLIGAERYGVLAIAWLLLGYFGMFDLGLGRATIYRIAEQRDGTAEARRLTFHTAIAVNLAIGIVGGIILAIGAEIFFSRAMKIDPSLRAELSAAAPLLGLSLPIATLTGVLSGALQGRERFVQTNVIGIVSTILFQIVPLMVVGIWGTNVSLLILAGMTTRVVTLIILFLACNREFGWAGRLNFDRNQIGSLMKFGGWVTLAALIAPFLTIIDRFAIGALMGAAAVTFYSVPYLVIQRVVIIPTALTNALFPRLSAARSDIEIANLVSESGRILLGTLTAPVLVGILLAKPALSLWMGTEFASKASPPAEILLFAFWFNALALLPFTVLQARGRPHTVTYILAFELLPYLAALYIGVYHFGLIGAAYAFLFRCALDFGLLTFHADRKGTAISSVMASVTLLALALALNASFPHFTSKWFAGALILTALSIAEGIRTTRPTKLYTTLVKHIPGRASGIGTAVPLSERRRELP